MIAVETNILVYAHRQDSVWHAAAAACVRRLAEAPAPWLIPWPCVHEFYAVVTNPRIYPRASTIEEAIGQIECWLESPSVSLAGESPDHWVRLCELLRDGKVSAGRVHDARIAAICTGQGVRVLWTADRDFSRFGSLRCENPLVAG